MGARHDCYVAMQENIMQTADGALPPIADDDGGGEEKHGPCEVRWTGLGKVMLVRSGRRLVPLFEKMIWPGWLVMRWGRKFDVENMVSLMSLAWMRGALCRWR